MMRSTSWDSDFLHLKMGGGSAQAVCEGRSGQRRNCTRTGRAEERRLSFGERRVCWSDLTFSLSKDGLQLEKLNGELVDCPELERLKAHHKGTQ
jgi:hypothetical protein